MWQNTVLREKRIRQFLIIALTISVDLDNLLAEPFFDSDHCSIGTHPLHSCTTIGVYLTCLLSPHLRIIASGLLIHMTLDGTDCLWLF